VASFAVQSRFVINMSLGVLRTKRSTRASIHLPPTRRRIGCLRHRRAGTYEARLLDAVHIGRDSSASLRQQSSGCSGPSWPGLLQLVTDALSRRGEELMADLGGYLPCRVLVLDSGGVEEIWCALSSRAADGTHARDRLRDVLFAALEDRFPDAVFEVRGDWPTGQFGWWEVVRLACASAGDAGRRCARCRRLGRREGVRRWQRRRRRGPGEHARCPH
jgi:hypothetical protein